MKNGVNNIRNNTRIIIRELYYYYSLILLLFITIFVTVHKYINDNKTIPHHNNEDDVSPLLVDNSWTVSNHA